MIDQHKRPITDAVEGDCPPNLSFKTDIAPLFTAMDISCMANYNVFLDQYESVKTNAQEIYNKVSSGDMPPADSGEPAWTTQLVTFQCWMQQGC